jgi:hypothetical protein
MTPLTPAQRYLEALARLREAAEADFAADPGPPKPLSPRAVATNNRHSLAAEAEARYCAALAAAGADTTPITWWFSWRTAPTPAYRIRHNPYLPAETTIGPNGSILKTVIGAAGGVLPSDPYAYPQTVMFDDTTAYRERMIELRGGERPLMTDDEQKAFFSANAKKAAATKQAKRAAGQAAALYEAKKVELKAQKAERLEKAKARKLDRREKYATAALAAAQAKVDNIARAKAGL